MGSVIRGPEVEVDDAAGESTDDHYVHMAMKGSLLEY